MSDTAIKRTIEALSDEEKEALNHIAQCDGQHVDLRLCQLLEAKSLVRKIPLASTVLWRLPTDVYLIYKEMGL